jgi:hypothetical protein
MPPIIKYTILADEVIYKKPQPPVIHFETLLINYGKYPWYEIVERIVYFRGTL